MNHPSAALRRVLKGALDPKRNAQEVGRMITGVPGLGERLVRYVAAYYGFLAGDPRNPVRVTALLGPRVVGQVAVQHALVEALGRTGLPVTLTAYLWTDWVHRALASRLLALRDGDVQPDEAFTAGLASAFGVACLLERHANPLEWVRDVRGLQGESRVAAEKRLLGGSRLEAFQRAARAWELPGSTVGIVATLDRPNSVEVDLMGLKQVVQWADALGEAITSHTSGPALEAWVGGAVSELGMEEEAAWTLVGQVIEQTPAVAEMLGVGITDTPSLEVLRQRRQTHVNPEEMSQQELVAWARVLQEQNVQLEERRKELVRELERLATVDAVTGLPGHQGFLAQLSAKSGDREGCLLLVDIDDFHGINQRFGFDVGDLLLDAVAKVLRKVLRDADQLARVGADSFATWLATDERGGRIAAERVRAGVEAMRFDHGRVSLRVTASVYGLVTTGLPDDVHAGRAYAEVQGLRLQRRDRPPNRSWWVE